MSTWMGPWFGNGRWFGPWFDSSLNRALGPGYGPPGSATFVLNLESGFTVKYQWKTDIIKRFGGTEQRIAVHDMPKQFYRGSARLISNEPRTVRSQLARYAAIGSQFLIGLPHEEMTLVANASGTSVFVNSVAAGLSDWARTGQRCVVVGPDGSSVGAVVQSVSGGTIVLDVSPGIAGNAGGRIMPAMASILDPQQGFSRYAVNTEEWELSARAALFDFVPGQASLPLDTYTVSAAFNNAVVYAKAYGYAGNAISFRLALDALGPNTGTLVETDVGTAGIHVSFSFKGGVTTLGDLATALANGNYCLLGGTYNPTDTIAAGDDFGGLYTPLSGATQQGYFGRGASLTTYDSRPVWDRPIQITGTAGDSIQAMTEVIDMGGVPYSLGSADFADWGRHVMMQRHLGADWQWFKLFVATVRGRQKAFWLPSYRDDFTFVSKSTNTITISNLDGSDFFAWWPYQRDRIQIEQTDGTITRAQVTAAVDNGNGTSTLTIGTTISGVAVSRVSWLELCRFESDDFDVSFQDSRFSVQTVARVVRP